MAVAFDAAVESERTGTTDPHTWTHTPVGVPRAVLVSAVHGVSTTDHVVGVTYGGVAMARVIRRTDTATELGAAEWWFLGASIPTGAQTVSADLASGTTDDIHFTSISYTASRDCEVVDSDGIAENAANPSVTLQYAGRTCAAVAALYGGGASPAAFTPNANCQTVADFDLGAFYSEVIRQTTPGSADFAIGGTAAVDDVAYVALALSETLGPIAGTSDGVATASGTMRAKGALVGSSAGSGAAAATLSGVGALAGAAAGAATATGTLTEGGPPSGAITGSSAGTATATGTLAGRGLLAASVAGVATAAATLAGDGALSGSAAGVATATGTLTPPPPTYTVTPVRRRPVRRYN